MPTPFRPDYLTNDFQEVYHALISTLGMEGGMTQVYEYWKKMKTRKENL